MTASGSRTGGRAVHTDRRESAAGTIVTEIARRPAVLSQIALLEAWIESQMEYRGLPGLSIGVVYDQELAWARGFGYADVAAKTPATPATVYRIASISKLFTATAVMQ